MDGIRNSTMLRRALGARLRGYREQRAMTIDQVGARIGVSRPTLSRIETGNGVTRKLVLDALVRLYDIDEIEAKELATMADAAREPSWWEAFRGSLPHRYDIYLGLESSARRLRAYESHAVPELLQTAAYARAVIASADPDLSTPELESLVELRLARQRCLTGEGPLELALIVEEAALYRPVGGTVVQRQQLEQLVTAAAGPHVALQVLPTARGAHPGFDGAFTLLSFDEHDDVGYVEGQAGGHYMEDDATVARIARRFEALTAVALDPAESKDAIAAAARRMID